jgi:predicted nucleotidyltransferase component of viral defense system
MLFALQRTVLAALGQLDASDSFALAGGAALIVHGVVDRTTRDLDLFTEESRDVATLHQALTSELVERGLGVTVISAIETFVRLEVHDPGSDERIEIDLGVDVRMAAPVTTEVGRVLSIDELAADKLLALFGRAELRDFLDVADLLGRFPKERLIELAVAKDAGFTLDRFAESLAALHRFSDADWQAHDAERERFTRMFDEWRAAITT